MPLELINAAKKIGDFRLENISIKLERGELVSLMGRNGSGKSTLLQILSALEKPDEGRLRTDSEKKVGFVFQAPERQLFSSTVKDDVLFALRKEKLSKEQKEEKARAALALLGLDYDKIKYTSPFTFSGGEKRRIAIAGVLIMEPDYLLLDEPFSGLDYKCRKEFFKTLERLKEKGAGILLVTHSPDIAVKADRLLVMEGGRVAYDGSPSLLWSKKEAGRFGLQPCTAGEITYELRSRGYEIEDSNENTMLKSLLKGKSDV